VTVRTWIAVLCLVAGVPIAAYGLAGGGLLLALVGLALVLSFVFLVIEAFVVRAKADAPQIKPAANAAWNLKDQPLDPTRGGNATGK
jgi:uncharacterized membrane protein YkgB